MLKMRNAYILLFCLVIIVFILNLTKPPIIESEIGTKEDIESSLKSLENKDNLVFYITEEDKKENTYKYEIYDKDSVQKNGISKNKAIQTILVRYDNNDRVKNINYKFTLNNKDSLEVLESLVRSTLIDLTDKGYYVFSKYMKFPYTRKTIINKVKYVSSDRTFTFFENTDNTYEFMVK